MTGTERQALNERIALAVGWIKGTLPYETIWASPEDSSSGRRLKLWKTQDKLPDFTRKWEHAGPLFAKLISVYGGIIRASARVELQLDEILRLKKQAPENIDTLTIEAIAVAFDAWKEEKE